MNMERLRQDFYILKVHLAQIIELRNIYDKLYDNKVLLQKIAPCFFSRVLFINHYLILAICKPFDKSKNTVKVELVSRCRKM